MSARIVPAASTDGLASVSTPDVSEAISRKPRVVPDVAGDGNVEGMSAPTFLTVAMIAERVGVKPKTVRNYHTAAEQRRRAGTSRPGDFPAPDQRFGLTPVWKASTVRNWERRRPGRGAGGGRPRKEAS